MMNGRQECVDWRKQNTKVRACDEHRRKKYARAYPAEAPLARMSMTYDCIRSNTMLHDSAYFRLKLHRLPFDRWRGVEILSIDVRTLHLSDEAPLPCRCCLAFLCLLAL
jgi:hypothetical protein